MGYRSLRECIADLERTRQLVRIDAEIDPILEAAEIQRRVYKTQGPAVLYARVKGCRFAMVSNLFGTLPQVYTEDADHPGWQHSNLGMYRVQISGNQYDERRIGLHYQIHRGIGVHHAAALRRGVPFRVSIWIGGPPAMTLAAVMPL